MEHNLKSYLEILSNYIFRVAFDRKLTYAFLTLCKTNASKLNISWSWFLKPIIQGAPQLLTSHFKRCSSLTFIKGAVHKLR